MHFINPFIHTVEILDLRPKASFSTYNITLVDEPESAEPVEISATVQYYVDRTKLARVFHIFHHIEDLDKEVIQRVQNYF